MNKLLKNLTAVPLPSDITKKQIKNDVIQIAWPALVELILVQLCSVMDSIMVGNYSKSALASVGFCTQPIFLLLCTFIAFNSGATAVIARLKGAGEDKKAKLALIQSIVMSFFISIILAFLGYIFAENMIVFMGAETEETIKNATSYYRVIMLFFPFNVITFAITAGLRGIGKTKISMYYNLCANIINVILNYLLIYGNCNFPCLGVTGAAIATGVGQFIAFVIAICVIFDKKSYFAFKIKDLLKFNIKMCKRILNVAIPALFEQIALRVGIIIYTLTVTSLGETAFSAHVICLNIMGITFMNGQAFGIAAATLLGQSMGKKRIDVGMAYTYQCRKYGMYISITLSILFLLFGNSIVSMFTQEMEVISIAADLLIILAVNQPLQTSQLIISGALRGAGDTKMVAVMTLICMLFIRPIGSIIAVSYLGLGVMGAWSAVFIDQVIRAIITYIRFAGGKWKRIEV